MTRKIAFIELDTHAEIARNFVALTAGLEGFSTDFYFSPKIAEQVGAKGKNIQICDHEKLLKELTRNSYDLVIIGTAHRYFKTFLKVCRKFNTAVIVHNINFSRISKAELLANVFRKDFKYRLKLLLKEGLLSAPDVYTRARHRMVLDQAFQTETESLKFFPVFYFNRNRKSSSPEVTIVIPGAVSQQRRDYRKVLDKIKDIDADRAIRFVFLGKASGEELGWLQAARKNLQARISIEFFEEKVPQPLFDEWMQKSDALWCPIQRETEFMSCTEFYGSTKMSGNIGDAVKYGKPAIFPPEYKTPYSFIFAEEADVVTQFEELSSGFYFDFEMNFGKEKIRKQLMALLSDLAEKKTLRISTTFQKAQS